MIEIIAVDNASTDGSAEMVRDEFPDVRLVPLPDNIGAAARNAGVAAAKGDVVFTLDNDVLFGSPDDVSHALAVFERRPRAAGSFISWTHRAPLAPGLVPPARRPPLGRA